MAAAADRLPAPPPWARVHSVWEVCQRVRALVSRDELLAEVWVRGELSNVKRGQTGHLYFTLKDEHAQLACVLWRDDAERLPFALQDGLGVLVHGRMTLFEARGQLQLAAFELHPDGHGKLALAFEQLKQRLAHEGLFREERKRPLPRFPLRIGVVTSLHGAALRDVLRILSARFPLARVLVKPVRVQGAGAAEDIARAIRLFNHRKCADVLIVGRGGGSLEDLWAFNEEGVARAIAGSVIPVVSAVGHETDTTIADFVADHRAPTPSGAAEHVVPDAEELDHRLERLERALLQRAIRALEALDHRLEGLERRAALRRPDRLLGAWAQRLDEAAERLARQGERSLERAEQRLGRAAALLDSYSPLRTLERGYAIVSVGGRPATRVADLPSGAEALVRVGDGSVQVTVHG